MLGLVAIFIALGGTAYATHPGGENTVSTADLQNLAVTTPKIANEAVTNQKIEPNTIRSNSIRGSAVTNDKIAQQTIQTGRLADLAVTTPKLANGAVDSAKVLDNSLTGADIQASTLGKVPDADRLDGIDSIGFIRGRGLAGDARVTLTTSATDHTLLTIPQLGELKADCRSQNSQSTLHWAPSTTSTQSVWVDDGGSDPAFYDVLGIGSETTETSGSTDRVVYHVSGPGSTAIVSVLSRSEPGVGGGHCRFLVQATRFHLMSFATSP